MTIFQFFSITTRHSLLFICLLCAAQPVFSQDYSEMTIQEIETLLEKVVAEKDYSKAHQLQTVLELKRDIQIAVEKQDYKRAAELKEQLPGMREQQEPSKEVTTPISSGESTSYPLEYYNTMYVHDGSDYRPLERQEAKMRTSTYSAVWVAETSSFWEVEGMYSTTQIDNKGNYTFFVKLHEGVDPVPLIKLNRLDILGKEEMKRSLLSNKTTAAAYAGAATSDINESEVSISFEKVADEVYRVVIEEIIPPGEYAFAQGSNWFLFGSRNQYTNSDKQIERRDLSGPPIFNEDGEFGRTAWLGFDYSLLRIKTEDGLEVDHEKVKEAFQNAVDKINYQRMENSRDIGKLFSRDKGLMWNPVYIYEFNEQNAPDSYVIPPNQPYELTDAMIEENLQNYAVNYPKTGVVILPGVFDIEEKELRGRAVWFDFDTREIVFSFPCRKRLITREDFREQEVWADFYDFLKVATESKDYRKEWKKYN